RYFGTKIAFYFAWLGYYTKSLYIAAFMGIITVLYGIINLSEDVMSYLFDNGITVIFAALMCVWATFFLEGWKRYHAEIAWKWGLLDFVVEEDTVRPEFQFRVKTKRYNPVTQQEEPYLSGKKKIANFLAGGVTMCLVLAVVFGMVVYRVICMRLLASFYNSLAHWLTRWECPRTQADFDNSYTFKVFLFQFANYYSSLFYVAFFKGVLSQLPGTRDNDGNVKIAGYRLEKAGHLMNRWEADYYLNPTYDQFLFDEYLEMVLQFGFVTLFVVAFPLAPLFAVLNNILEIRLDAYKFLITIQKPVPAQ
ncbi:hypothetical protein TELCIR_20304, partial [Teladorsagia circumcincta]